jgi:hypothetical protein
MIPGAMTGEAENRPSPEATGGRELLWPTPEGWEEDGEIKAVDHTGDDPGPERVISLELRPLEEGWQ